ncbi:NADH-quinone oxidoreductase subunit C [Paenibacillus sp. GP183]|uniref:NADH-quinone oxidoreductase subunit C n=1 Tax=Paenibacillus sp. GP183 TaxID=1882751 RepID=UPI000895E3FE|nr:NADH-quinone oxidoreductase subunit C [Paenibacillus sp. GP183]SEC32957.1 NADH-quinone oxidoreductase subunit C [Paenibacillus sp. GP183]
MSEDKKPDAEESVTPSKEESQELATKAASEADPTVAAAPNTADAAAAAKPADEPAVAQAAEAQEPSDAEKEAKAKAAAEARAARASARAGKPAEEAADAAPKEPSPNQPMLDRLVQIIKENVGEEAVEQAFINEKDNHLPLVVIKNDLWGETALLFKIHDELQCNYLRNVSGVDQETHLEVVYHLLSLSSKKDYCVKVKADREQPSIPSVTAIWPTANWNEREVYDLFGIHFSDHPDLRRIMMPDDWVGHPLRKDYEPLDPEV